MYDIQCSAVSKKKTAELSFWFAGEFICGDDLFIPLTMDIVDSRDGKKMSSIYDTWCGAIATHEQTSDVPVGWLTKNYCSKQSNHRRITRSAIFVYPRIYIIVHCSIKLPTYNYKVIQYKVDAFSKPRAVLYLLCCLFCIICFFHFLLTNKITHILFNFSLFSLLNLIFNEHNGNNTLYYK